VLTTATGFTSPTSATGLAGKRAGQTWNPPTPTSLTKQMNRHRGLAMQSRWVWTERLGTATEQSTGMAIETDEDPCSQLGSELQNDCPLVVRRPPWARGANGMGNGE